MLAVTESLNLRFIASDSQTSVAAGIIPAKPALGILGISFEVTQGTWSLRNGLVKLSDHRMRCDHTALVSMLCDGTNQGRSRLLETVLLG